MGQGAGAAITCTGGGSKEAGGGVRDGLTGTASAISGIAAWNATNPFVTWTMSGGGAGRAPGRPDGGE